MEIADDRNTLLQLIVVRMVCLEVVSIDSSCAGLTSLAICALTLAALTLAATIPFRCISELHLTVPIVTELTVPWRVIDISADSLLLADGIWIYQLRVFSLPENVKTEEYISHFVKSSIFWVIGLM